MKRNNKYMRMSPIIPKGNNRWKKIIPKHKVGDMVYFTVANCVCRVLSNNDNQNMGRSGRSVRHITYTIYRMDSDIIYTSILEKYLISIREYREQRFNDLLDK